MKFDKYPVISSNNHCIFEFFSHGSKGTIRKIVSYQELHPNSFNLAFGDWNEVEQKLDDKVRSNNDDMMKVLATVAFTSMEFVRYNPGASIVVEGSTSSRTRLYQMGIFSNWAEISRLFEVEGLLGNKWVKAQKNINYDAFTLIAKK